MASRCVFSGDDCGLTVVQYVRMDGEITLRIGEAGERGGEVGGRLYLNGTHSHQHHH